jgi:hypothetical protein
MAGADVNKIVNSRERGASKVAGIYQARGEGEGLLE